MEKEDIILGCSFLLVIAFLALAGVVGISLLDSITCGNKWSSFEHTYSLIGGCKINLEGKWIPAESYYFKEE